MDDTPQVSVAKDYVLGPMGIGREFLLLLVRAMQKRVKVEVATATETFACTSLMSSLARVAAIACGDGFTIKCTGDRSEETLAPYDLAYKERQKRVRFDRDPERDTGTRKTLIILSISHKVSMRYPRLFPGPQAGPWRVCGVEFLLREAEVHRGGLEQYPFSKLAMIYDLIVERASTALEQHCPDVVVVHMGEAFLMNPVEFHQAFSLLVYRYPDATFVMERPEATWEHGVLVEMDEFKQPPEIQCAAKLLDP